MRKHESSHFLGRSGEEIAWQHLARQGFTLLERNRRFGRAEVDLILKRCELLLFVEVKYRRSLAFGYPESFMTSGQQARYHEAAEEYIALIGWEGAIRFDIVALHAGRRPALTHFEDAF